MLKAFKKTKTVCTSEDARFLFLLFLGREPYVAGELETYTDQSFFGALKRLLRNPAFSHSLFDPFVLGKTPMRLRYSTEQLATVEAGLHQHFGLSSTAKPGDEWLAHLSGALAASRLQKAFISALGADRLDYLQANLKALGSAPFAQIYGGVHQASGSMLRGFAVQDGSDEPLTLDFFLDGEAAGTATADQINREVNEQYQTTGTVGFSHTLETKDRDENKDSCLLVFERSSGAMLCPPRDLVLNVRAATQTLARALHELNQLQSARGEGKTELVSDSLSQLMQRLPSLEQHRSLRLKDYALYRDIYRAAKPANTDALNLSILVVVGTGEQTATQRTHRSLDRQSYRFFTVIDDGVDGGDGTDNNVPSGVEGFDLLVRVNAGDMLDEHALACFAAAAERHPSTTIIRAGYDHYSADNSLSDPVFVSRFDPLILAQNPDYARAFAVRVQTIDPALLPAAPDILWSKVFAERGDEAFATIDEILLSVPAPLSAGGDPNLLPLVLPEADTVKKMAIIIPTKDGLDILKPCVESLLQTVAAKDAVEIIIVDNASEEPETAEYLSDVQSQHFDLVRVVNYDAPFNWADINNTAAAASDADYLLFLNNDTLATNHGWDLELRRLLAADRVGVVGAKLLYEDETIQHAGVVLNDNSLAVHEGAGLPATASGYDSRLRLTRQCEAVTGAFLGCTREAFELVGGFDGENFPITFNDVDFCLKITETGRRVIYSPLITFYHLESVSRGYDGANLEKATRAKAEHDRLRLKWVQQINSDRWYPARLTAAGNQGDVMIKPPSLDHPDQL